MEQKDPDLAGDCCLELLGAVFFFCLVCIEGLSKEEERIASPELVVPIFIAVLYSLACHLGRNVTTKDAIGELLEMFSTALAWLILDYIQ